METDYLIVGAGALGLGFVDQILTDSDASITIIDKHRQPGGHWNDAYSFVRLHQPSAFYGVGSCDLGSNQIDETGFNRGFYELASGAEVRDHFLSIMQERFLPSGRVTYLPGCEYTGNNRFRSLTSGEEQEITVRRKLVDATYFNTAVPATSKPGFDMGDNVRLVAPNALPGEIRHHSHFTIVGGGKTGMDVGVWLLGNGVEPENIRWIVPRDSWLINREIIQPGDKFYLQVLDAKARQLECCATAKDTTHLFELLEQHGLLMRIDNGVRPAMFHNATIAPAEMKELARIRDVIRLGRVKKISAGKISLERGEIDGIKNSLHINCTASATPPRPVKPIFDGNRITIQIIRPGLFCLSTAVIAHVEASYGSDEEKNHLCIPQQAPDLDTDWLRLIQADGVILNRWAQDRNLRRWVSAHRLTGARLRTEAMETPEEVLSIKARIRQASEPAEQNLSRLIAML